MIDYLEGCGSKRKKKSLNDRKKKVLNQGCGSKRKATKEGLDVDMWYGDEFVPGKYGADAFFNDMSGIYTGSIYDENGKRIGDYSCDDSVEIEDNFQIAWNESYKRESNHTDLVSKIYSVMANYEYGYDPDMSDLNAMLQDLVIRDGVSDIKSDAFKKAWIAAHNKIERKTWGNSGDAMHYDSLTPREQEEIDDFDEDYWIRWRN